MHRLFWPIMYILSCTAVPSTVYAQGPLDVVELTNGGFVRGTVVVYEPGQPVMVQLPNGTTRTFAPGEVARVRVAGAAEAAAPARPAAEPPPPPAESAVADEPVQATSQRNDGTALFAVSAPDLENGVWRMDDGEGEGETWPDFDPAYQPRGDVHVGVAGGVGVTYNFGFYRGNETTGVRVEVAALLDVRPVPWHPYRFRAEAVLAFMSTDPGLGLLSFFLRVHPLGLDLGDLFVLRIGGEIGGRHYDADVWSVSSQVGFFGGPLIEIAVTLVDRRLEVGALFALPVSFGPGSGGQAGFESTLRGAYLF